MFSNKFRQKFLIQYIFEVFEFKKKIFLSNIRLDLYISIPFLIQIDSIQFKHK